MRLICITPLNFALSSNTCSKLQLQVTCLFVKEVFFYSKSFHNIFEVRKEMLDFPISTLSRIFPTSESSKNIKILFQILLGHNFVFKPQIMY